MKFTMNQQEIEQACSDYLQSKFQSSLPFDRTGHVYIPDLTFAEMTQDYIVAKEAEEARLAEWRRERDAEETAKKTAEAATAKASETF